MEKNKNNKIKTKEMKEKEIKRQSVYGEQDLKESLKQSQITLILQYLLTIKCIRKI